MTIIEELKKTVEENGDNATVQIGKNKHSVWAGSPNVYHLRQFSDNEDELPDDFPLLEICLYPTSRDSDQNTRVTIYLGHEQYEWFYLEKDAKMEELTKTIRKRMMNRIEEVEKIKQQLIG